MHQPTLRELLADLFANHGYTVSHDAALEGRSGTLYTIPLLAEDGERYVLVDCADDPVEQETLDDLAQVVADVGADIAVLAHTGIQRGAASPAITVWDRNQIAALVGDALVASALGVAPAGLNLRSKRVLAQTDGIDLTAGLDADYMDQDDSDEAEVELGFPGFDLDGLTALTADQPPASSPQKSDASQASPGPVRSRSADSLLARALRETVPRPGPDAPAATPPGFPCLAMEIDLDQARHLVRQQLSAVERAGLVLQPVWIIDYECDLLIEGTLRSETVSGCIEVHGTSRMVTQLEGDVTPGPLVYLPDGMEPEERPLRTSRERALSQAHQAIVAAHTRVVQVQSHDPEDNFTVSEKKRVEPRPDHVRLKCRGTFHRPLWRLSGVNGTVEVDAVTGDVMNQQLRSSSRNAVMLE